MYAWSKKRKIHAGMSLSGPIGICLLGTGLLQSLFWMELCMGSLLRRYRRSLRRYCRFLRSYCWSLRCYHRSLRHCHDQQPFSHAIVAQITKHSKTLLNVVKYHETLVKHHKTPWTTIKISWTTSKTSWNILKTLWNIMKHTNTHHSMWQAWRSDIGARAEFPAIAVLV